MGEAGLLGVPMEIYTVHLGCPCPGAIGWSVRVEAESPADAIEQAKASTCVCPRCGHLWANCDGDEPVESRY